MRLLVWVLFATFVTFLSYCEADSSNTNKRLQRALYSKMTTRGLTANGVFHSHERSLRGGSNKIADMGDGEERAIGQKIMNVLKQIKDKYLQWEQKILIPKFEKLAKEGKSVSTLTEKFRYQTYGFGWFGTPSGHKRFIRLYKTWLEKNNPDLL
ncbi:Putative RxLR effector [Phytophthora palmivora]|uniref:RxLR effector protein n=1 Tax=Phytophthora palmivora TaxID=4796 RepID=A0A2P4YBV1_9STRA|nr:Putative RxLR effector [Phytophthora palmivora]